jgi:putative CocE/NonD family hydrolase
VQDWPAYYLFVMGENQWRGESEWPLKRTRFTSYFLHSGGGANSLKGTGSLSTAEPADEPPDQFTYDGSNPVPSVGGNNLVGALAGPYDQTKVEEREDVLVYLSSAEDGLPSVFAATGSTSSRSRPPFAPTSPPSSPTSAKPPSGPPACHDSGISNEPRAFALGLEIGHLHPEP